MARKVKCVELRPFKKIELRIMKYPRWGPWNPKLAAPLFFSHFWSVEKMTIFVIRSFTSKKFSSLFVNFLSHTSEAMHFIQCFWFFCIWRISVFDTSHFVLPSYSWRRIILTGICQRYSLTSFQSCWFSKTLYRTWLCKPISAHPLPKFLSKICTYR